MISLVSAAALSDPGQRSAVQPMAAPELADEQSLQLWQNAERWRPQPSLAPESRDDVIRSLRWFRIIGVALSLIVHVAAGLMFAKATMPSEPQAVGASLDTDALMVEFLPLPVTSPALPTPPSESAKPQVQPPKATPKRPESPKSVVSTAEPLNLPPVVSSELAMTEPAPLVSETEAMPAPTATTEPVAAAEPITSSAPAPTEAVDAPLSARGKRAQSQYLRALMAWLAKHRVYPTEARKEKLEGVVQVRFSVDRDGHLLAANVQRSAGSALLDAAALAVLERADPMPPFPKSLDRQRLTVSLPIDFSLQTD